MGSFAHKLLEMDLGKHSKHVYCCLSGLLLMGSVCLCM